MVRKLLLLLLLFVLSSCNKQFSNISTANPNPVSLSSNVQKKIVRVKYVRAISTDNRVDIVDIGRIVKNDWVKITYNPSVDDTHIVIEVEENLSIDNRTYYVKLTTGVENMYLPIIQKGKTSE